MYATPKKTDAVFPSSRVDPVDLFDKNTSRLRQPLKVFSELDVARACYERANPMLRFDGIYPDGRFWVLDIGNVGNRKLLCYKVIQQVSQESSWFKSVLEEDYDFVAMRKIEEIDFEREVEAGAYDLPTAHAYRELYTAEATVLVQALEQALALIYYNPLLREMLEAASQGSDVGSEQLRFFRELIEKEGLSIVVENHSDGLRGDYRNHGSLFGMEDGSVQLRLDLQGEQSIGELIHEYAAFLLLRYANKGSGRFPAKRQGWRGQNVITPDQQIEALKKTSLSYVLLFMDAFAQGAGIEQINLHTTSILH